MCMPESIRLMEKLRSLDFSALKRQLEPVVVSYPDVVGLTRETLLTELLRFLVLKKLAGDFDAHCLSPSDLVDAAWHMMLLNPKLYLEVNRKNHNPEGGSDAQARLVRLERTKSFYRYRNCHTFCHSVSRSLKHGVRMVSRCFYGERLRLHFLACP